MMLLLAFRQVQTCLQHENYTSSPKNYSLVTTSGFVKVTPKDAISQIATAEARGECFAPLGALPLVEGGGCEAFSSRSHG